MTNHLRTEPPIVCGDTRVTRCISKDSSDDAADQFAAMFASLCLAPTAQLPSTPIAKSADASKEIPVAIPFDEPPLGGGLQMLSPDTVLEPQEAVVNAGALLPGATLFDSTRTLDDLPASLMEPENTGPTVNPRPTLEPSPEPIERAQDFLPLRQGFMGPPIRVPVERLNSPTPETLSRTVISNDAPEVRPIDPIQLDATDTSVDQLPWLPVRSPIVQSMDIIPGNNSVAQILRTDAARREANLIAGYFAKTTPNDRDVSGISGVKNLFAGNGFDTYGDEGRPPPDSEPQVSLIPGLLGRTTFASAVRDFTAAGGAGSVSSQVINQILSLTETLGAGRTRSLRLRLRPEELGQIDIQLSRDAGGRISAHIFAERETARQALSQSLGQLRETLSRAGLNVDKLQISGESGLFAGNNGSNDARSYVREPHSQLNTSLVDANETDASGRPLADSEKLLSLRA